MFNRFSWAKYEESPEIMAESGYVVFTKTASVGKTAYIENMPKEMTINPQLVLLKKFRGVSKYLAYILKTTYFQNEVKKITGVRLFPVTQSSLAKIEIPPIEVQTEIVRISRVHFARSGARSRIRSRARLSQATIRVLS